MKEITIKEFQHNIYAGLKELPITITKNGKPLYIIRVATKDEEQPQVATNKHIKVATSQGVSSFKLCHYPMCNEYAVDGTGYCKSHTR